VQFTEGVDVETDVTITYGGRGIKRAGFKINGRR
jgi:hypothetical protein